MHDAPSQTTDPVAGAPADPAALVDTYLTVLMKPDPDGAMRYVAPGVQIRFTGGREMQHPAQCTAFNRSRYAWVKKRFIATEVMEGGSMAYAVVYNRGMLYGEWLDGTPFDGNRYVDRYVIRAGLIAEMDVWNDSAEWLLERAGQATP